MKLSVDNMVFSYGSNKVLKGISFRMDEGEIVSVIGPNGSGKSTLIKCIEGILKPEVGSVYVGDKEAKQMGSRELAKIIGYVPQDCSSVFSQRVFETVLMGRRPHLTWGVRKKDVNIVEKILDYMEISHLASRYLDELSGGQRQRVIIARALAQEPKILLLDEPTSNLDIRHQLEVLEIVKKISRESKSSVLMVIHDLNLAARFSDKLIMLKDGNVLYIGNPKKILTVENINEVYEVESTLADTDYGQFILPVRPSRGYAVNF